MPWQKALNFHLIFPMKFELERETLNFIETASLFLSQSKMLPHISKCALNRHSNYVILSGITHLGRKTTKDMGCCKVETLSRHDSMHAYKLEMVSYKTSCPHYKMRFHQVAFSREKAREPKKHFCQVQAPGSAINLLKYLLIFGCQIEMF